jgi:hypothetical protein
MTQAVRTAKGPRAVAALLPADVRRAFRERGFVQAAVVTEWPAIVGAELAARCCPERLGRDGTLRVRAQGAAAPYLQHLAPQILERVATFFGYRAATRLVIAHGPSRRPAPPTTRAPRALSGAEESGIADRTAGVEDDRLRAALERLGRAVAAWRQP